MNYEKMSREELIATLVSMVAARSTETAAADDAKRLFHDLQVHQMELEMQNRELDDARSELEESRNRYADLYDFAPVAYLTLDADGVVHDLNLSAAKLLGHERERIVGHQLTAFLKFEQPAAFWHHLGKCAAAQHPAVSEFRVQVGEQTYELEAISVSTPRSRARAQAATSGGQGALQSKMFRTAFADITGRKRAEAQLERACASEQHLRAQIEAVDRAHVEVSTALAAARKHRVTNVVEAILRHAMTLTQAQRAELQFVDGVEFGPETARRYTSGRVLPSPCPHFFTTLSFGGQELAVLTIYRMQAPEHGGSQHDRTLDMYGERIASCLEVARLQTLECRERERLATLDHIARELEPAQTVDEVTKALAAVVRHAVPAIACACTVHVRLGDQLSLVGYQHVDPARRERLADALQRPGEELEQAFRKLADLPEAAALLSFSGEGARTRPFTAAERKALAEVFEGELLIVTPLVSRGRSLGVMCFDNTVELGGSDSKDVSLAPALEKSGDALARAREVAARCAASLDIGFLVDELHEAVRWRESVMATVSHDLRSPLNTIALGANAILGQSQDKHVNLIQRSVNHMDSLIQELVTMSSLEAGAFHVDVAELAARDLIEEAALLAEPLVRSKSIRFECSISSELSTILADRARMQRVFGNLFANAVKYTQPGGTIRVAASQREDRVLFSVSDSGKGIPEKERSHIFQRFWRGNAREHGLGLGLYIARSIVEAHGGKMWVETASLGGAKLCFDLPRASAKERGPALPEGRAQLERGRPAAP